MVRVTRLRHTDCMYINPDLIERVEGVHQTVIHMLNGVEYVVVETPEQILEQIVELRVGVVVAAGERLTRSAPSVAAALVAHIVAADRVAVVTPEPDTSDSADQFDLAEPSSEQGAATSAVADGAPSPSDVSASTGLRAAVDLPAPLDEVPPQHGTVG